MGAGEGAKGLQGQRALAAERSACVHNEAPLQKGNGLVGMCTVFNLVHKEQSRSPSSTPSRSSQHALSCTATSSSRAWLQFTRVLQLTGRHGACQQLSSQQAQSITAKGPGSNWQSPTAPPRAQQIHPSGAVILSVKGAVH